MSRILLMGATGQLGQELQRTLPSLGEVVGVGRKTLDLADATSIRRVIQETQPDLIVNAAAYTAVDQAETETEQATLINAIAPTIIAEEAQLLGADLIHVSTDYVFDGQKNTPYTEQDATNPLGVYGRSKLAGEVGILKLSDRFIILRTAWVYGAYGQSNFVKTMLRLFAERDEVRVVADQVGTPTWAGDIARAITTLGQHLNPSPGNTSAFGETTAPSHQDSTPTGIYHFTNSGVASWYDFAVAIFEEAKQLGFPLKVQRIVPITTLEFPTPAQRPAYSVLWGAKLKVLVGDYPPHWRQALRLMLEEFYSYNHQNQ